MGDWRAWGAVAVGPGAVVVRTRRLHGGITSVVHAVDVVDRSGVRHRLVLRRYPPGGPVWPAFDIVTAEVRALAVLEVAATADVPRCVAFDATGRAAGVPTVLSTRLPGRPILAPSDPTAWAAGLARAVVDHLVRMRDVPSTGLNAFRLWSRGAAPPSAAPHQAIHRDFNPGNILWSRGRVTGIVDWVHLCHGPIEADIGRCRVNIWLLEGRGAADAFQAEMDRAGIAYAPAWDAALMSEMSPHLEGVLAANRLGARLTPALLRRRAAEILRQ